MQLQEKAYNVIPTPEEARAWLHYDAPLASTYPDSRKGILRLPSNLPYPTREGLGRNGLINSLPFGPERGQDAIRMTEAMLGTVTRPQLAATLIASAGVPISSGAMARIVNGIHSSDLHDNPVHYSHFYKPAQRSDLMRVSAEEHLPFANGNNIRIQGMQHLLRPQIDLEANTVAIGHIATELMMDAEQHGIDIDAVFGSRKGAVSTEGMVTSLLYAVDTAVHAGVAQYDSERNELSISTSQLIDLVLINGPYLQPERQLYMNRLMYPILQRWDREGVAAYESDVQQAYVADDVVHRHAAFCRSYQAECERLGGPEHVAVLVATDRFSAATQAVHRVVDRLTSQELHRDISLERILVMTHEHLGPEEQDEFGFPELRTVLDKLTHRGICSSNERGSRRFSKRIMAAELGEHVCRYDVVDEDGSLSLSSQLVVEMADRSRLTADDVEALTKKYHGAGLSEPPRWNGNRRAGVAEARDGNRRLPSPTGPATDAARSF